MSIVIDARMKVFAEKLNITSSRMVNDYGLKNIDDIIEAEASKGNAQAVKYAQEMYSSPAKLVHVFKLANVENKYTLIHNMDQHTRERILPMLSENDLVMGLYFFTQDKLLELLEKVSMPELVNVVLNAFSLPDIIMMFSEDDLAGFFQQQNLERNDVINELRAMPRDVMEKFVEGITGRPFNESNPSQIINNIAEMPIDKYREFMSAIDPDVQRQLTFQLTKKKPEYLMLFEPTAYTNMLESLMKQDMIKPMIGLKKETLVRFIDLLPSDMMSIVAAQVDTKRFAEYLIDGHLDVLKKAKMI